jgi:hypothetical protein
MILISNRDREEVLRLLSLSKPYVKAAIEAKKGKKAVRERELLRRIFVLEKSLKKRPTIENRNDKTK